MSGYPGLSPETSIPVRIHFNKIYLKVTLAKKLYFFKAVNLS